MIFINIRQQPVDSIHKEKHHISDQSVGSSDQENRTCYTCTYFQGAIGQHVSCIRGVYMRALPDTFKDEAYGTVKGMFTEYILFFNSPMDLRGSKLVGCLCLGCNKLLREIVPHCKYWSHRQCFRGMNYCLIWTVFACLYHRPLHQLKSSCFHQQPCHSRCPTWTTQQVTS